MKNKVRSLLRYRQWSVSDGITTVTDKTMSRFKVRAAIKTKRSRRWRERLEREAMPNREARYQKYAKHGGHAVRRDEKHDAMFCADCNEWIETACGDAGCEFCATRPPVPIPPTGAEIEEWLEDIGAKP